jgi:alpha-tubulin suppressor-like RCC1 family protein
MVEALMGLSDVVEFDFAVGGHFGCARTAETLRCWGSNQDGELGDGRNDHGTCGVIPNTYDCSRTPVEVSTLDATAIAQVELGSSFACALLDDGTVWCWGANALGQLGNGTTEASDEPVQIEGLTGVTQIALGPVNACALLDSGDVRCWGSNEEGQIGDGAAIGTHESCTASDTTVDCVLEPTAVALEVDATFVSVGIQNGCVIGDDGEVYCWGWNDRRQLGQEDRERRTTPIAIAGLD